jgi:hypothetical protein
MPENLMGQPDEQGEGVPPVVENSNLPRMTARGAGRSRRINGRIVRMPENPQPEQGASDTGGNRMAPMVEGFGGFPDQEPRPVGRSQSQGYLRLRLRVEHGQMAVMDAHRVEGPLIQPASLQHNFAYEVTVGARRVGVGSIPDLGVIRSVANPDGPPEQHGHYFTPMDRYDITVRIPEAELSLAELPQTEVALYEIEESAAGHPIQAGALRSQLGPQLREIARLKGIQLERLPQNAQGTLRATLR